MLLNDIIRYLYDSFNCSVGTVLLASNLHFLVLTSKIEIFSDDMEKPIGKPREN